MDTPNTCESITQHCMKTILDQKRVSTRLDSDMTRNKTERKKVNWFHVSELKLYVTVCYAARTSDSGSGMADLLAKVFCDKSLCPLFIYELQMQQKILPKIEFLLDSQIGPEYYYHSGNFRILFLKDLLKQGYQVKSFKKGLNLTDCTEAIKLMAKLHAASVALHEQDPELVKSCRSDKFLTQPLCKNRLQIFQYALMIASDVMEQIYPVIAAKIESVLNNLHNIDQIIELFSYEPEEFCVLNNGDFSTSNLLFPDNSSLPLLLQHYQMATYSSPAIDLHHFLNTSPETAVIHDHDEELLQQYLETLTDTMKALNCTTTPPTMKQLKAAMRKRKLYAVLVAMFHRGYFEQVTVMII
ncbi:uncharacterized protein LOC109856326 isoform X2 [Pseudomyrmex gracilis]|uniref:uncharacterized protein LOC109856326 isoform X2 n=1 Tax=Pseudomyrmex gracilis TaxID=219809 RepID=UPI0009949772|nr:uncharacterized protein LOC109856326 isoform X2 [Pseudomyrmex gracilis]